jgi:hypothetical protein
MAVPSVNGLEIDWMVKEAIAVAGREGAATTVTRLLPIPSRFILLNSGM